MIESYTNQSLTLTHPSSINEYNEPGAVATSTIRGRKENGNKLVRNKQGEEVVSTACVFTKSAVVVGDSIDGALVISVEAQYTLGGSILFYEVYLQ